MSWSISTVGNVGQIMHHIQKKSENFNDAEKKEFDEKILPALTQLLSYPYDEEKKKGKPVIKFSISSENVIKPGEDGTPNEVKRTLNLSISSH